MHNAPSVSYPVGRSRFQAGIQCALWLLGLLVVAAWCAQTDTPGWRQVLAAAMVLLAGGVAVWGWRRTPVGRLRWDGQQWFWLGAGEPVAVQVGVRLDLQRHLLLALQPAVGRPWGCWAERASQPQRWRDLRRAVYSPARPLDEPGDGSLSAP